MDRVADFRARLVDLRRGETVMLALLAEEIKRANVGSPMSESDCGIFNETNLEPSLTEGTLGLSDPAPLPRNIETSPTSW